MKTITFRGDSDDTFGCYWEGGDLDHDDYARGTTRVIVVTGAGGRLAVTGVYAPGHFCGCWSVGLMPLDEDEPMPPWPMRWRFEAYSTVLEIEVPDGATVRFVVPGLAAMAAHGGPGRTVS